MTKIEVTPEERKAQTQRLTEFGKYIIENADKVEVAVLAFCKSEEKGPPKVRYQIVGPADDILSLSIAMKNQCFEIAKKACDVK